MKKTNQTLLMDVILILLWGIAGTAVLIAGPTRITYGCVWVMLLVKYIIEIFNSIINKEE